MNLRVKEICKEKGLQLKDVAEKMGIARESLTRAINGNPQLTTLMAIADALNVDIHELLPKPAFQKVFGFLEVDGKVFKIQGINDLKEILEKIE